MKDLIHNTIEFIQKATMPGVQNFIVICYNRSKKKEKKSNNFQINVYNQLFLSWLFTYFYIPG